MIAAVLHRTGPADSLRENLRIEEIPEPVPCKGEALISVKSASLNHRDLWIAQGLYAGIKLPVVPGSDCAGIVEITDSGENEIQPGDEVIVNPSLNWSSNEHHQPRDISILGMPENGTFAQFVKVPASKVFRKPSHLTFAEASAIPLAGVTAYRALFTRGNLSPGENVLVTGIGGGVAMFALKFAIAAGANVFVTSGSPGKIQKAISLGASAGLLYTGQGWHKEILSLCDGRLDLIVDGSGGSTLPALLEAVSYGGRIVLYGSTLGNAESINLHRIFWKQISVLGSTMGSQNDFEKMLGFINHHNITPAIDSSYPLSNCAEALIAMKDSAQFGKIILEIG